MRKMTDAQWTRMKKRMPKWKELQEAYAEHKENMLRHINSKDK